MSQDEEEMTARVIRAMENEYVTMLGHATGRLLLQREAYKINLEKSSIAPRGPGRGLSSIAAACGWIWIGAGGIARATRA